MKELSIIEIRERQLAILTKVVKFCIEKNITYWLCGGTLLGAVRHGGYIPWDDDIDIMMPRPAYEKFKILFHLPNLYIASIESLPNYSLPFIKICEEETIVRDETFPKKLNIGLNIDVFPIDGFPEKERDRKNKIKAIRRYVICLRLKSLKLSLAKNNFQSFSYLLSFVFMKIIPYSFLINAINRIAMKHTFEESDYVGIAIWGYGEREICKKDWFSIKQKMIVNFEGLEFNSPVGTKYYLSAVYGNYMELPSLDKRSRCHLFKVYLKNVNEI